MPSKRAAVSKIHGIATQKPVSSVKTSNLTSSVRFEVLRAVVMTFRRNMPPPSSGSKNKPSNKP
jgi:hypothetical protein